MVCTPGQCRGSCSYLPEPVRRDTMAVGQAQVAELPAGLPMLPGLHHPAQGSRIGPAAAGGPACPSSLHSSLNWCVKPLHAAAWPSAAAIQPQSAGGREPGHAPGIHRMRAHLCARAARNCPGPGRPSRSRPRCGSRCPPHGCSRAGRAAAGGGGRSGSPRLSSCQGQQAGIVRGGATAAGENRLQDFGDAASAAMPAGSCSSTYVRDTEAICQVQAVQRGQLRDRLQASVAQLLAVPQGQAGQTRGALQRPCQLEPAQNCLLSNQS